MPVNPAAGSPNTAVKKLLDAGAKEGPVEKAYEAPATKTAPQHKTAVDKTATPSRSPARQKRQ